MANLGCVCVCVCVYCNRAIEGKIQQEFNFSIGIPFRNCNPLLLLLLLLLLVWKEKKKKKLFLNKKLKKKNLQKEKVYLFIIYFHF